MIPEADRVPKPCVAYYRVSTEKQGKSGNGLADQRKRVERFVESGQCTELIGPELDDGIGRGFVEIMSGRDDNRPELKKALDMCLNRGAQLVVARMDRLSRSAAYALRMLDDAEKGGVEILFADDPHASRLSLGVQAVVAEETARRIARNTKAALAAKKAKLEAERAELEAEGVEVDSQNFKLGTPANLTDEARAKGRRVAAAKKRERARKRAKALQRDVDELKAEGQTSLRQLAAGLEERGCRTPGGKAKWSPTQVSRLLKRLSE